MKHLYRLMSFAAAIVLASAAFAQSEVTDAEIDASIQTLKEAADAEISIERGFNTRLTGAQMVLARNPEKSLDKVALLLDEPSVQMRLNAAIVMTQMAHSGYNDPKLIQLLQRCIDESSDAVVYWGLTGLTDSKMPDDVRRKAVAQCLTETKPRIIRLAAIMTAQDGQIKSALPWLVEYMKELLPQYDEARKDLLAIKQTVAGAVANPRDVAAGGAGMPPNVGLPAAGGGPNLMGNRGRLPGAGGAVQNVAGPAMGGARPAAREVITGYMNPEKDEDWQNPMFVNERIQEFEENSIITELQAVGFAVETLAKKDMRDQPFEEASSFEYNPPWRLRPCVEAAIAWLDKNRGDFTALPEPKVVPTPAEETVEATDADNVPANDE